MRHYFVILLFLIGISEVYGQISFKSNNQQFIENSIKPGLFLSRQSFQICDKETGELFGLNGKKEFGVQYTIGVKCHEGFFLVDQAVRPWLYNNKFEKYKAKYDPVFYQAMFSEIGGKANYDPLDYTLTKQEILVDTTLYQFSSRTFKGEGFKLENSMGEKDGWVVWITASRQTDFEEAADLSYTIYKKDIKIDYKGQSFDLEAPNVDRIIVGGIYVVPVYVNIGVIEFRLCGVLVSQNNQWKIFCPFGGMEEPIAQEGNNLEEVKGGTSELTPVEKDNKGKAQKRKEK